MIWKPYIDTLLIALYGIGWCWFGYQCGRKSALKEPLIEMPKRGPGPVEEEIDELEEAYISEGDFGG